MELPKISIIIPVYNSETYLHSCVDSILAQIYTNWELILVDDGSPDKSGKICDEYANIDSRVHVIHMTNEGVGAARNAGIEIATGDRLGFIDSDDIVEPTYLETFIKADNNDLIVCGYLVDKYDKENRLSCTEKHFHNSFIFHNGDNKEKLEEAFASGIMHMNWNKLFNTDIIKRHNIRYKPYTINEDFIFTLHYLMHCKTITFLNDCTYHWIRREGIYSGVLSIPNNIIPIYEESHMLLTKYLCDNMVSDRIMYKSYEIIVYKLFYAYKNKTISKETCFSQLKKMHTSKLVNKTFRLRYATTLFTKMICLLHRIGLFKLSFMIHKYLIWR